MRTRLWIAVALIVTMNAGAVLAADLPCATIVGILATSFDRNVRASDSARIEVRQCLPTESATLQIIAWRTHDPTPALIVDTNDFGIVQVAARKNVFVIETGGATRDQVFVITYIQGQPKVALRRATRGSAVIHISMSAVDVVIDGIYAGDEPARTESHKFVIEDLGSN